MRFGNARPTFMADSEALEVEVVYALPEQQRIVSLEVPAGTTASQAARLADIPRYFPGVNPDEHALAIFGDRVKPDHELASGDRVEILRPLKADPKAVRREMAKLGKTMGDRRDEAASKPD